MTKKAYDVDWVVYGTVRGVEAESEDAAHKHVMAMGMEELIERSVQPTLEAGRLSGVTAPSTSD